MTTRTHTRSAAAVALSAATVLGVIGLTPGAATAAPATPDSTSSDLTSDFNGDGLPDLAITAPAATVNGLKQAGAVTVVYGSAGGYDTAHRQIITQATDGVPGDPTAERRWGHLGGNGDLNGDGHDDLLIRYGSRWTVLWGGADGLSGAGQLPAGQGGEGTATSPWLFNYQADVGDIDGDGTEDVAAPAQADGAWGLAVYYGPFDRTGTPARIGFRDTVTKDAGYAPGTVRVGDMTGDGVADIVTSGNTRDFASTGRLYVGSAAGLTDAGTIKATGTGAFGDLDHDGYQDFVGGNGDAGTAAAPGGAVYVTYGGPKGLSTTRAARTITQASTGVPGADEKDDRFGDSVALGDTNGDGYADLVIGTPFETGSDAEGTFRAGAVTVLRGGPQGVTTTGAQVLTQNTKGVPSTSEVLDHFGAAVRVAAGELLVGGNGEDSWKGRVWRLPVTAGGVTGTGSTSFSLAALSGASGPSGAAHFGEDFSR
ncbi:FG-GAP-like repeat-containing protein [Streptomyces sp. NBC_01236]|uniref:FG-GAP-like repeat-containing protein n=1 Tax=Streptomyces sp. NBC_01236 TaxID=2903789 RepID=UPI002E133BA8|nr:integrin alpha [Streptomyces sp. NBC_01236]